jgi:hypothetical protein
MVSLQVERPATTGIGSAQQIIVKLKRASAMAAGQRCCPPSLPEIRFVSRVVVLRLC